MNDRYSKIKRSSHYPIAVTCSSSGNGQNETSGTYMHYQPGLGHDIEMHVLDPV